MFGISVLVREVKCLAIEVFSRVEKKYVISNDKFLLLKDAMKNHMVKDKYNKDDKPYHITNIYYDTIDNYLIRNSTDKPYYKEKLRLRGYGVPKSDDMVYLEIKKKCGGVTYKRRSALHLYEAYEFVKSPDIILKEHVNKQVLAELKYFINTYKPVAKMKVSYDRFAFFSNGANDLRVSFDTNIRTDTKDLLLENENKGNHILKEDLWVMEIKTSEAIPMWLTKLLSENAIYPTGFSKYGTGHKKEISEKRGEGLCLVSHREPLLAKSLR